MKTDDLSDAGTPIHNLDGFQWYTMNTGKVWKGYNGNIDISPERGKLYYCNSGQVLSLDLENLSGIDLDKTKEKDLIVGDLNGMAGLRRMMRCGY